MVLHPGFLCCCCLQCNLLKKLEKDCVLRTAGSFLDLKMCRPAYSIKRTRIVLYCVQVKHYKGKKIRSLHYTFLAVECYICYIICYIYILKSCNLQLMDSLSLFRWKFARKELSFLFKAFDSIHKSDSFPVKTSFLCVRNMI